MYRRPKFLEVLLDIRQEMAREADYDVDLFAEIVRSGQRQGPRRRHSMNGGDAGQKPDSAKAKAAKGPAKPRGR